MRKHPVKLSNFLSVCINLAEYAGNTIKQINQSGNYRVTSKNSWDLFTIADITVQKTIMTNLKMLYPNLKIVGEEDEQSEMFKSVEVTLFPDQLHHKIVEEGLLAHKFRHRKDSLKQYFSKFNQDFDQNEDDALYFNQEDAVIWIDPLDGTRGFARGDTDTVTSLLGVTIGDNAKIGVIHKPFFDSGTGVRGRTYFGSVETGTYYIDTKDYMNEEMLYDFKRAIHYLRPFKNEVILDKKNYEVKTGCTMNRFSQMQAALEQLQPCVTIRIGGGGNKAVYILEEYIDYMAHVVQGLKTWDICAADALIKARFGYTSDKDKQPLLYDPYAADQTLMNGILMARSQQIYDLCYERLQPYLKELVLQRGKL